MNTERPRLKRYLENDQDLLDRVFSIAKKRIEAGVSCDDYFQTLSKTAHKNALRIKSRVDNTLDNMQDENLGFLKRFYSEDNETRNMISEILREEVRKRKASKVGLASYLTSERLSKNKDGIMERKRLIDAKYINPNNGAINIDELKHKEYFASGPGSKMLPVLEEYHFGVRSKIRRNAELEEIYTMFTGPELQYEIDSFINLDKPTLSKSTNGIIIKESNNMPSQSPARYETALANTGIDKEKSFTRLKSRISSFSERATKLISVLRPLKPQTTS